MEHNRLSFSTKQSTKVNITQVSSWYRLKEMTTTKQTKRPLFVSILALKRCTAERAPFICNFSKSHHNFFWKKNARLALGAYQSVHLWDIKKCLASPIPHIPWNVRVNTSCPMSLKFCVLHKPLFAKHQNLFLFSIHLLTHKCSFKFAVIAKKAAILGVLFFFFAVYSNKPLGNVVHLPPCMIYLLLYSCFFFHTV